ncbi:patatin-like phospholipase family protein [Winogradskya consettensis]|uniref:Patatin n=1 Tax=Winogradskya consettensis TaxID=113560 RepID=A0A919T022_9ACTN|nr:patatin-like phospholipase family protein [Actinoplanes consettensis]GIM81950.1 patatin [Actinoplanes consettensis]
MKALVLGGGGITGIAWELGLLAGLRHLGTDLSTADVIVGTSAGAYVGALIATGIDLDEAIITASGIRIELSPRVDPGFMGRAFAALTSGNLTAAQGRAHLGALAREAPLGDDAAHVAQFAAHLPVHTWPVEPRLIVTGVDTATGELTAWDATSGVPLPAAVAASCALPGVFPPVHIGDNWFMDGGVRSVTNTDLATGADSVIVITPSSGMFRTPPATELESLNATRSLLIAPDGPALTAIGPNILDPSRLAPALQAGAIQATTVAEAVAKTWL